jgi:hypothetical protein
MSAFCCNCQEDFPVAPDGAAVRMGFLFPLVRMPKRLRDRFASWRKHEDGSYLCGNCYFDLTDED